MASPNSWRAAIVERYVFFIQSQFYLMNALTWVKSGTDAVS
jgi:hypothetical protein